MNPLKKLAAKLKSTRGKKKKKKGTPSKETQASRSDLNTVDTSQTVPPTKHQSINPPARGKEADSTKPGERGSKWTVTDGERYRYQKTVLGMSDAQIARQLKPGHYEFQGSTLSDRPSGEGDLAYRYGYKYRYRQTAC